MESGRVSATQVSAAAARLEYAVPFDEGSRNVSGCSRSVMLPSDAADASVAPFVSSNSWQYGHSGSKYTSTVFGPDPTWM